ncbi:MAG TPA: dethiobiotin synthase [Gemmatimonadales bacterium]|nr:dethiobiotin synthase [Gemmatimonadales bacterium]
MSTEKKKAGKSRAPRRAAAVLAPSQHTPVTLIVGTDTDVGKTWVTAALARALREAGQRVVAIKPVETGCGPTIAPREDGVLLAAATGQAEPKAALIRLTTAVSAAWAAEREGVTIEVPVLSERIRTLSRGADQALVELAGGLLSPLTWTDDALDLAHLLDARALVVAADRLGSINHTLLTIRALKDERIPILGVVLSTPEVADASTGSNAEAIHRLAAIDAIVTVPRLADTERAAEAVKEVAGWVLDQSS